MINADDEQQPVNDSGVDGDARVSGGAGTGADSTVPAPIPSPPALKSLASRYKPEQHATYLRHLEEAVKEPKNLNIALTGRYGAGKSSVLDEFESKNKTTRLRLAIATLAPDSEGVTLTNRIQKELVKQLLYRAAPRKFPFSRFNRIVPLSRKRAFFEATIATGVVGAILVFIGWLPAIAGTGSGHHCLVRVSSWLIFVALVVVVLSALRRVIYGRFVVSDVSAAGAAVKLTQHTSTYFDEYLEEIVYFFDEVSPDIVIFEDLDRFDDPHIFEALRELNTLLNNTAKRRKKRETTSVHLRHQGQSVRAARRRLPGIAARHCGRRDRARQPHEVLRHRHPTRSVHLAPERARTPSRAAQGRRLHGYRPCTRNTRCSARHRHEAAEEHLQRVRRIR